MLRMLGSFLPPSVRRRQIHEWQDQLDCTRATNGNQRRELFELVRSAAPIAWIAMPFALRISLPPLVTAMMAALLLWPPAPAPDSATATARTDLVHRLETSLLSIENGLNRYVTTRESRYLATVERELAAYPEATRRLAALTPDDPRQQARVAAFVKAMRDYDVFWVTGLAEIASEDGFAAAHRQLITDGGRSKVDRLRAHLERLSASPASNAATRTKLVYSLETSLLSVETGLNRYVTTHESRYLETVKRELAVYPAALGRLTSLTSDDPRQQARVAALAEAIRDYDELWVKPLIEIVEEDGFLGARHQVETNGGRTRLDDIRAQMERLVERER